MDNKNKKNKSISRNIYKNTYKYPKSIDNHNCLGPCYPPNTVFYHPLYLTPKIFNDYVCPIYKTVNKDNKSVVVDKCYEKDLTTNYKNYELFEDIVQIANTPESFLEQIYNIVSIQDIIRFLNNSIDELPIYTQKRILDSIYSSFITNDDFPKELFSEKVQNVLKNIYNINISVDKINNKIFSNKNIDNIFLYLIKKYSKNDK